MSALTEEQADVPVRVVTYSSRNAPVGFEAVAHLWLDGRRLPIVFTAATEQDAESNARAHWATEMAKHRESILNRAAGRAKAAEARARKGQSSEAEAAQ